MLTSCFNSRMNQTIKVRLFNSHFLIPKPCHSQNMNTFHGICNLFEIRMIDKTSLSWYWLQKKICIVKIKCTLSRRMIRQFFSGNCSCFFISFSFKTVKCVNNDAICLNNNQWIDEVLTAERRWKTAIRKKWRVLWY